MIHQLGEDLNIVADSIDVEIVERLRMRLDRRRALGGGLYLFNMKDEPMQTLRQCGAVDAIGADNFFPLGSDPIQALYARLDSSICADCPVRIFDTCGTRLPDGRKRIDIVST